jgi:hypothetical protein
MVLQRVGYIKDGVYHTFRRSHHIFRRWKSFGISVEVLEQLRRNGVKEIAIHYFNDREHFYLTTVEQFLASEKVYDNKGDIQKHIPISSLKERYVK